VPKNHPLGRRRRILFSETLESDFIGLGEGNAIQQFLAYQANRLNRRLKIRVRLPSFDDVCRMVEQRVGVAIVPDSAAQRCQAAMNVRKVNLADRWAVRELRICVRSLENLPPAPRRLVEHLKAV
jgi:DNA-binding transcriptional LysR family regulator